MVSPSDLGIDGVDDLVSLDVVGSVMYRAREIRQHRLVAIKILDAHPRPLMPPRLLDPRQRSLHAFAKGPGIVPIYSSGRIKGGDRYVMMPYYKAGSLADQLAYGSTPWHASAELIARSAELLAPGHAAGVALTGIKPSSILLADAATPLLAVYGMSTGTLDDDRPSFRAPELATPKTATPAADVFSLGLTLAALIAGWAPTAGHCPTTKVSAMTPERIVEVILRATDVDPTRRYRSAGEFAVALQVAIEGDRIAEQPPPPGGDTAPDLGRTLGLDDIFEPTPSAPSGSAATVGGNGQRVADRVVHKSPPPLPAPGHAVGPTNGGPTHGAPAGSPSTNTPSTNSPSTNSTPLDSAPMSSTPADSTPATSAHATAAPMTAPQTAITATLIPPVIDLTELEPEIRPGAGILGQQADVATHLIDLREVVDASTPAPVSIDPAGHLDDDVPFRPFERQGIPTPVPNRFVHLLDPIQVAWIRVRRSLGALLAAATLMVIAGIVAMIVFQQRQAGPAEFGADPRFTPGRDVESPSTFAPTSVAPIFLEPPATHESSSRRLVPVTGGLAATAASGPTGSAAPPTTRSATASTAAPLATAEPGAGTTSPRLPTPSSPSIDVSAARLRRTSAQIRVSSPTCVTTSFSYATANGAIGTVSGGNRCATSHTLNLGRVTAALTPETRYTVTVTATDESGRSTRSRVSFTTLP